MGPERNDTEALADAVDRFLYDLTFTAPEMWSMRVNQLAERTGVIIVRTLDRSKAFSAPGDR
jgi:hypothetical protein